MDSRQGPVSPGPARHHHLLGYFCCGRAWWIEELCWSPCLSFLLGCLRGGRHPALLHHHHRILQTLGATFPRCMLVQLLWSQHAHQLSHCLRLRSYSFTQSVPLPDCIPVLRSLHYSYRTHYLLVGPRQPWRGAVSFPRRSS